MKLRAIILIIVVAVIVLSVTGVISLHAMFDSMFGKVDTGEDTTLERTVNADEFSNLVIEWAAGSIKIITADTNKITIQETKKSGNTHAMVTEYDGDTMTIRYASGISANMANLSAKHLTITVPQNWNCEELEINGAALDVNVSGLTAGSVELSGAATKLNYTGSFDELECDGAAAQLKLDSSVAPSQVSINGAACKLDLIIPADTGFAVKTEGMAVDFNSNSTCSFSDNTYTYGDGHCKVHISGLGCKVSINVNSATPTSEQSLYSTAEKLVNENKAAAAIAFGKLDDYSDARQRSIDLWEELLLNATVTTYGAGLVGIRNDGTIIYHSHMDNPLPEIETWSNMRSLAAGQNHFVGLKADGTVIAAGSNEYGQCNVSGWTDIVAIDCGWDFTVGLKTDGSVVYTGIAGSAAAAQYWTDIAMIEAVSENIVGLKADGTAVALGNNETGLCNVPVQDDIIDIYLDHERAIYLRYDGSIKIMGNAQFIDTEKVPGLLTIESDGIYLAGKMQDGGMYFEGYEQILPSASNVVDIVDFSNRKLALKTDGTLVLLFFYSESMIKTPEWTNIMLP